MSLLDFESISYGLGSFLIAFIISYHVSVWSCKKRCSRRRSSHASLLYNKDGKRCEIIAHKCAAIDGPENTIGALRKAAQSGADGLEIDISMTKDEIGVLMHDDTILRTTDGSGKVSSFNYDELSKFNAAAKFKGEWAEVEMIPLLTKAIEVALENNLFLMFDVKHAHKAMADVFVALFKETPELYTRAVIGAFDFMFLYRIQKLDPAIGLLPIYGGFDFEHVYCHTGIKFVYHWIATLLRDIYLYIMFYYVNPIMLNFDIISVSHKIVDDRFISWWKEWSKEIVVWTVNEDKIKYRFIRKQIPIITDRISFLELEKKATNDDDTANNSETEE